MSELIYEQISIDDELSTEVVPKFYAYEGKNYVISIIDSKFMLALKTFFIADKKIVEGKTTKNILGTAFSNMELVKIMGKAPNVHCYIPIVKYPLKSVYAKDGYGEDLKKYSFEYLKLGPASFKKLQQLNHTYDINNMDIVVSVESGKQEFQALNFIPAPTNPKISGSLYKNSPDLIFEDGVSVKDRAEEFKHFFASYLQNSNLAGTHYTVQEVKDYLSGKRTAEEINKDKKNNAMEEMGYSALPSSSSANTIAQPVIKSLETSNADPDISSLKF